MFGEFEQQPFIALELLLAPLWDHFLHLKKMWTNTTNEHFMVWMRTAGLPNFRKLWGRINSDLKAGKYIIEIENNYSVKKFEGEKYFVLSTVNAFGGKNYFLGISYICVGGICLIMALLFFFGYKSHSKTL